MQYRNLYDYNFQDFHTDLEDINQHHAHKIQREEQITHRDEFALAELMALYPRLWDQYLEGWSRSYYEGSKHLESILQFGIPDVPISKLNQHVYRQSMLAVKNELCSLQTVKALDVLSELDQVRYEQSSAAGYNYDGRKGPIGGANHMLAIRRAKALLWSVIKPTGEGIDHAIRTSVPDVGYTRTQLTDLYEKTKIRGVWGRAFHYILLEGTVGFPLLQKFKEGATFFHIGSDPTISVPDILSHVSHHCEWLHAIDWSQFDATVSRFEIHACFDIIREIVTFPNEESSLCFELCRQLFIHKKIAAPDGKIYWVHKGLPSGSYFTSIGGSIINRLRIEYLWRILFNRGPKMCYTQGDDSIVGDDVRVSPEALAEVALPLNWNLNPTKCEVSRMPEFVSFLGRTTYGGINQRDLKKCLRLLIFPEYPVPSGEISAYRAQSIARDAGNTSSVLNDIALRLRRKYGIAREEDVPHYFKIYIP